MPSIDNNHEYAKSVRRAGGASRASVKAAASTCSYSINCPKYLPMLALVMMVSLGVEMGAMVICPSEL